MCRGGARRPGGWHVDGHPHGPRDGARRPPGRLSSLPGGRGDREPDRASGDDTRHHLPQPGDNPAMGDLILAAKEGHAFSLEATGDELVVANSNPIAGANGLLSTEPKMNAIFVASGAGIRSGMRVATLENLMSLRLWQNCWKAAPRGHVGRVPRTSSGAPRGQGAERVRDLLINQVRADAKNASAPTCGVAAVVLTVRVGPTTPMGASQPYALTHTAAVDLGGRQSKGR